MQDTTDGRGGVLSALKRRGRATIAELAADVGVSAEAARQHLQRLAAEGFVEARHDRAEKPGRGRPVATYRLTPAGENLFPKAYDALAAELLGALSETLGPEAAKRVLSKLAEARVKDWAPLMEGKSLEERVELLRGLYARNDPFMSVEKEGDTLKLVERNCPFFNVASEQPLLCSLSVSVLSRLLGRQVTREERFQEGAGRCVFRVLKEKAPSGPVFREER